MMNPSFLSLDAKASIIRYSAGNIPDDNNIERREVHV